MKEYKRETISTIVEKINKSILLPDIQRPFVWDEDQIYKLFDSLMRGYPINTFLFWELTKEKLDEIEAKQKLSIKMYSFVDSNTDDNLEEINREKDSYQLVLDGQQRLTSLFIALKGSWKKKVRKNIVVNELYFNLLSGHMESEEGTRFEFKFIDRTHKELYVEELNAQDEISLKVWVNVKKIFENNLGQSRTRREFINDIIVKDPRLESFRDKLDENLDDFDNVLKKQGVLNYFPEDETSYEKVLDIFVRTNSGGTKLGYSDLLFSKIKLSWTDARDNFKELIVTLNKNNFEYDSDFILKTCLTLFASKSEDIRYSVSNLNNNLISNIREKWPEIVHSIKLTVDLLDQYCIKDKKQLPSYNALVPVIYWHFKNKHKTYKTDNATDMANHKAIRLWITKALLSGVFGGQGDSVLYKCKEAIDSEPNTNDFPAAKIQSSISSLKNRSMEINNEIFDQYSYRAKESYLFLGICYKNVINFSPRLDGNLPQQDHIFSKKELKDAGITEEKINSIYNIRLVSSLDNNWKSATPFSEWVNSLGNHKDDVFKQHSIPVGEWTVATYEDFLKKRKDELVKNFIY